MVTSVTEQNIRLDHADWTKNTVVKSTPTHGRGLFAARDIAAGELILCEKAPCLPNRYDGEEGSDLVMYTSTRLPELKDRHKQHCFCN
jgi:hypothetical protein